MGNTVFLIGYMGVGKTTLGKKLAKQLMVSFYDTDTEIEKVTGVTVPELFSEQGEMYFRNLETKWLQQFPKRNAIIATGGGMPCDEERITLMKSLGTVIYLERPAKELFVRLKNAKTKRPLITALTDEDLLTYIQKQLLEREVYYKQAHHIITRNNQDVESLVNLLENNPSHTNPS